MILQIIFVVSVLILFIVPVLFVWNEVYDDGLIGRVALVGISFSSFIFAGKIISVGITHPWPEAVLMMASFAIFLLWHLMRFHRRILRNNDAKEGKIDRRHHENHATN